MKRMFVCGLFLCFTCAAGAQAARKIGYIGVPDPVHAVTNRAHVGIPSLAVSPGGRLWATWYCGVTPNEDQNNYVVLATSGDNGKTWKECFVVDPDGPGPRRTFDPEIWYAPDGAMHWTWTDRVTPGFPACVKTDELWMMTFTDPDAEPTGPGKKTCIGKGVMMCKPTFLSDGTWALPVCTWFTEKSSGLVVSTDNGKTFSFRGGATIPKQDRTFDEHMFVEKKNGDLWCLSRVNTGIREAFSHDRGLTWSPSEPSEIRHPSARFLVRRLRSGHLILIKHGPIGKQTGRSHLTAYLSKDDGATWLGGLLLDARNGVSYPSGQEDANGVYYVTYDFARTTAREILFAAFTEADVLAKKDVSGKVRLRQLISKGSGGRK